MDEKDILTLLELPMETHVLRTFPFNRLAPQLKVPDKKFFQNAVDTHGVRLLATINTKTTNIPVYEDEETAFQEIHLFQIKLKDVKQANRVYKIMAEAMPYPLFIRFMAKNNTKWVGATHQRIAKTALLKIQKLYSTNAQVDEQLYLKGWAFSQSDTYHLKAYYMNMLQKMMQIELEEIYGSKMDTAFNKDVIRLDEIKMLDKKIATYISKAKKEEQMNKRVELQMKVNELKDKKERMIKGEM
jgi:hypothetical protein